MKSRDSFFSTIFAMVLFAAASLAFMSYMSDYKPESDMVIVESYRIKDLRSVVKNTAPADVDMYVARTYESAVYVDMVNNTSVRKEFPTTANVYRVNVEKSANGMRTKYEKNHSTVEVKSGFIVTNAAKYLDAYETEECGFDFSDVGVQPGSYVLDINGTYVFFTLANPN